MPTALPAKLRVTAAVLGCARRKDLCARFRAANPSTEFDLERSHKWMQGRAAPRSARVYDDWALVLGSSRSGAWIAACTTDAFIEEVVRLFGADAATLRDLAAGQRPPVRHGAAGPGAEMAFACYSPAWSPYFRGQLLRGSLYLEMRRGGERRLVYRERIGDSQIEFRGIAEVGGRTMCALLHAVGDGLPLCFSLYQPGMPASALAGIMAGSTYLAQEARPTTCRFVAVRVPQPAALEASNRYFVPRPGAVADDLMTLGLPGATATEVDAAILALLREGAAVDQVELSDQTRIAEAVDLGWISPDP
ncbi:hypothetical protein GXW78_11690 [Roseomonas terrae]|jgi:hypothetical protein|uniref:Uncharacterized protein n=1 Tax=Neoroseomonas terrae TaxID=424799 RepID=A0ABS5EH46_9PROT|nr:hypothetical protein [Neoroseomonas terrae]MBR0650327.1 hypothetical protein [Neoroseomonas terrae]